MFAVQVGRPAKLCGCVCVLGWVYVEGRDGSQRPQAGSSGFRRWVSHGQFGGGERWRERMTHLLGQN